VKPDLFIVADTLTPNDGNEHTYQVCWNLLTAKTTLDDQTHAVTTVDANNPNLTIIPLQTTGLEVRSVSAQTDPELLGWYFRADRIPEYAPATTVLHTRKGTGVENFLTLLVPIPSQTSSPLKSVEPKDSDSVIVTFTNGHVFFIVADSDPNGGIEVTETLPDGSVGRHVKIAAAPAAAASPLDLGPQRGMTAIGVTR